LRNLQTPSVHAIGGTGCHSASVHALKEWPEKSGNQIAEQIGCDRSYVAKMKTEIQDVNDSQPAPRTTGKDGKSYPATRTAAPRAAEPEPAMGEPDDEPVKFWDDATYQRAVDREEDDRAVLVAG
jgi:hypothetical protein